MKKSRVLNAVLFSALLFGFTLNGNHLFFMNKTAGDDEWREEDPLTKSEVAEKTVLVLKEAPVKAAAKMNSKKLLQKKRGFLRVQA